MAVHDDRQVAPLARYLQVRHVPYPHLVERDRLGDVRPEGHAGIEGTLCDLGLPVQASTAPLQASQAHQLGDTPLAHANAGEAQLLGHPRTAVEAAAARVHVSYLREQLCILLCALAGLTALPGVEARAGDLEVGAHHLEGVGLPVCRDE